MIELKSRVFIKSISKYGEIDFISQDASNIDIVLEKLLNNDFGDYRNYLLVETYNKLNANTHNSIISLRASKIEFKPYQFIPLLKILQSQSQSLLIADEVGLGKTIETGIILQEFISRRMVKNCFIVCPKSLCSKWEQELYEKFSIKTIILNGSHEIISNLKNNLKRNEDEFWYITTYESLRSKPDELLEILNEIHYDFDLIVCDESHRLRNRNTITYDVFEKLLSKFKFKLFLSATPLMLEPNNLFNQFQLLSPTEYKYESMFEHSRNTNRPFIEALNNFSRYKSKESVVKILDKNFLDYSLRQDPVFIELLKNLKNTDDSDKCIAEIKDILIELNSFNKIFTRYRRRDIQTNKDEIRTRKAKPIKINLTEIENFIYSTLLERHADKEPLAQCTLKRKYSSSIYAHLEEDDPIYEEIESLDDSKLNSLFKIIESHDKIIVFAFFKNTLKYIKRSLDELNIDNCIIHGDIEDRTSVIEEFKNNPSVKVLLSSEVGSTGLDLQFTDTIVNYDLPWNPMVVEQRIGRIDRIGQKSKFINVYSFFYNGTIEETIYEKLLNRIGIFKNTIGDLEDILIDESGSIFKDIESAQVDYYSNKLSHSDFEKRLEDINIAVETEKKNYERIKDGLPNQYTSDSVFEEKVNDIVKDDNFVNSLELTKYLNSFCLDYKKIKFERDENQKLFNLIFLSTSKLAFYEFVETYMNKYLRDISNQNLSIAEKSFKFRLDNFRKNLFSSRENVVKVTFDNEYAFNNKSIELISTNHPLILAINEYFKENDLMNANVFQLGLKIDRELEIEVGDYLMVLYQLNLSSESKFLAPQRILKKIIFKLSEKNPEALTNFEIRKINKLLLNNSSKILHMRKYGEKQVNFIREYLNNKIGSELKEFKEHETKKFESRKLRYKDQIEKYYKSEIEKNEKLLQEERGIKNILDSNITKSKQSLEEELLKIENDSLNTSFEILSLNHIQLYE